MGFLFKSKDNSDSCIQLVSLNGFISEIRGQILFSRCDTAVYEFCATLHAQFFMRFNQPKYRTKETPHDARAYFYSSIREYSRRVIIDKKFWYEDEKVFSSSHPKHESLKEALFNDEKVKKEIEKENGLLKYLVSNFERICEADYKPTFGDFFAITPSVRSPCFMMKDMKVKMLSDYLAPKSYSRSYEAGILILVVGLLIINFEIMEQRIKGTPSQMNIYCIIIDTNRLGKKSGVEKDRKKNAEPVMDDNVHKVVDRDNEDESEVLLEFSVLHENSKRIKDLAEKYNRKVKIETIQSNVDKTVYKFKEKVLEDIEKFLFKSIV